MGLRGPGAARVRRQQEPEQEEERAPLPWKAEGLSRAERVIAFLEFLPVTKGKRVGQKMQLLPEQRSFIERVYGDLDSAGHRNVRIGIDSKPKGNGKSGQAAGLALCHLLGPESEPRGEVDSAAIDRPQAAIIFNECEAIINAVPEFSERVNVQRFAKKIEVMDGDGKGSTYAALSADARGAHGLAPSLWIYDELAQAKDRTLLDNLINGMGKRDEALGLILSTQAPTDDHPLSQLIDDGLAGTDPSIFVQLCAAPMDADPFDEKTIRDCNPALGVFLDEKDIFQSAARAQRLAAFEPSFRNLRLNQRVDASVENRVVTVDVWKNNSATPASLDDLKGRDCIAGLDLSGKHDLTALVATFPDDEPEPNYDIVPFFWTPEGQMAARRPPEQKLFRAWIDKGFMVEVPGPVIRYGYIAKQLIELRQHVRRLILAYDRWRIDDLKQELDAEGQSVVILGKDDLAKVDPEAIIFVPHGQGYKDMSPSIDVFVEMALSGRLRHGNHPVLTASVSNSITVADEAGNLKYDKARANGRGSVRIDGCVALTMALGTAQRLPEIEAGSGGKSVYDQPGFFM
jgi:phage terminase large subunit-like protein